MATSPIYNWPEPDNTDLVKNGALAMRTLGDAIDTTMATMTPKSIVDAKGDLIAASAADTPARLAVGNNGETLVADSSASTGLRYTENYAAGKNKIINGDFGIWQRGTSFTSSTVYSADRWLVANNGTGTQTVTQQTFTPGTAPVTGYEGTYFLRHKIDTVGTSSRMSVQNRIEDVRVFSNQTITVSFWAKADAARTIQFRLDQIFGSGGSGTVSSSTYSFSATTSWTRFSQTLTIASIAGKTIGTSSSLALIIFNDTASTSTMDLWGVQAEAGSVATAFQTATGTIQGELAACQRYYYRASASQAFSQLSTGGGYATSSTNAQIIFNSPVTMRTKPTAIDFSTIAAFDGGATNGISAVTFASYESPQGAALNCATTGLTTFRTYTILSNNSTSGFIGISAEL
jgi:hypothetical protein